MQLIDITTKPIGEGSYTYTPKYIVHVSPAPTRRTKRTTILRRLRKAPTYSYVGGQTYVITSLSVAEQLRRKALAVGAKSRKRLRARREP